MKEIFLVRWALVCCLLVAAVTAVASDRPEPNAFLNRKANSVGELVREVQNDPDVADRYVRHFGKSREDIVAYFRTLHLARLNSDGTYIMYSVDDNGVIKSHPELMKKGTLVYADSDGVPILKAKCGNALVAGSNQVAAILNPTVGSTMEAMRTVPVTTAESMSTLPQTAVLTPTEPVALAPVLPPTQPTGSSNQGFALPAALAAIGGAGALLIGGGGNNPVPEPATIVVIAGALAAMKCRRRTGK
jgi:hypothetical protein